MCGVIQVPYDVLDDEIPDAWTCSDNVWDKAHNSCNIPQALSDEQIDEILMQQVSTAMLHTQGYRACAETFLCTPKPHSEHMRSWCTGGDGS
jgi:CW-type Zinc Finger